MFSNEFSYEPPNLLPQNRCFVRGFRQFHHMSQNTTPATEFAPCRHLTHPWQCDSQKNTQHDTSAPATQNDDGHVQSAVPATKTATHLLKTAQTYCACATKRLSNTFDTLRNTSECHLWMSRSGTPAAWSDATRRVQPPKVTSFAELTISNAIRGSCGPLRTVADGWATSSEHTLNPQTPEWNRNPCYAFGKDMRRGAGKKPLMRNRVQTQRKTKKAHYITYGQSEEEIGKGFFW